MSTEDYTTKQNFDAVPIIDFSLHETNPEEYFKQLKFGLQDVGFMVLKNVPGFEDSFQQEVFDLSKQLYEQPQEWKQQFSTDKSPSLRGYFRADTIEGSHKAHAEAFRFGADMPEPKSENGEEVPFWLRLHEGPNQWPPTSALPKFRSSLETLWERYHALNLLLNTHITTLLSIPPTVLPSYFPTRVTEFNSAIWHYFPCTPAMKSQAQAKGEEFVQGMHEHRDPSTFLTCLIQNRMGLQVKNHEGKWVDIPWVEGGVVVNVGMQLMKLTGGALVATTHRVNTLKIDEDRYTIPYVLSTRLEKQVVPLPQFASADFAKAHAAPNPQVLKLNAIEDPLERSGYARLSLFPAATQKWYPKEWEQGRKLGVL